MNQGKVEQVGTPADMYDRPATPCVRDFLGETITFSGTIVEDSNGSVGVAVANNEVIRFQTACCEHRLRTGQALSGSVLCWRHAR
jgi:ABC-type Fe3+/spermidine/putrescine transport system ATPase subunit